MKKAPLPIASAFALCLIALSFAFFLVSETPRGQVRGTIVLGDAQNKPLADCEVYLSPATDSDDDATPKTSSLSGGNSDPRERRHVFTNKQGRFLLRNVPAGRYRLSASSKWHSAKDGSVVVSEGAMTDSTVVMKRSEADLSVGDHQSVFATGEAPFLPVRGYATPPADAVAQSGKAAPASKLHVKIWRTRLGSVLTRKKAADDLEKLRTSYDGKTAMLTPLLLNPPASEAPPPVLITDTDLPVKNADREGFFAAHFPLAAAQKKPGLYLVKYSLGSYSACAYVVVTNLALVVNKAARAGQTVVYAADILHGTPIKGADVLLLRGGKTIAQTATGADGVASLQTPPAQSGSDDAEDETPTITLARLGDDEAVVSGSSYSGSGNGGASDKYVVHALTDRTVYRPGDTISYKSIVRERHIAESGAISYTIPVNFPVQIEMRDETGGLVSRQTKTTSIAGTVWGTVETSGEGGTGTYTLTTRVNGEGHESDIAVAAYRKPEFSVTVLPKQARYLRGETVEMQIKAAYYFGGPVAGATVHYSVYRDADWSAEYGDAYQDDSGDEDDAASYRSKSYQSYYGAGAGEGDIRLDENGLATVLVRTDLRHMRTKNETDEDAKEEEKRIDDAPVPQVETYTLTAEVQDAAKRSVEADGAASVASGSVTASVAPEGFVATPNKPMPVFVTVRDGATKKPKPGVPVTLLSVYDSWNADKRETVSIPLESAKTATTGSDGRAVFSITPPRAGDIRLTATIHDAGSRTVQAEGSLWAASTSGDDLDTDYADLSLLTDKRQYEPGDTAAVLINASRTGQSVLIAVEGERTYHTETIPITKRSTLFSLHIKPEWGPNVTLAAYYVRDKKFASSTTPLRVSLPAQKLTITVKPVDAPPANKYLPGQAATFAVGIKNAQTDKPVACDFALGVVDESIYALREDSPNAVVRTFYPRRTSRVQTSYSFSVEYLGDVSKAEPKIKARTRFRDTAYWKPDGHTDASGNATVSLTLPDNLTTWRATVQAVSDQTSVGYARSQILTAKPFFVRLEAPRYLVRGDKSILTGIVHNETGQSQDVWVKLVAPGLTIGSDETQTVTLAPGAVGKAQWPVSAAGNGMNGMIERTRLRLTAWTVGKDVGRTYNDGLEQSLPLRPYGRVEGASFAGVLNEAATSGKETLVIQPNALPGETRLGLRVTPTVRGAISSSVEYLVGFPYGCTEQTLSRFYPDLLASRYALTPATQSADLPRMVRDGVARLSRFQHQESGGWGWWEHDTDDPFMTAYALVGLASARQNGYEVSNTILTQGKKAAAKMAETAPVRSRPFLLYALEQAGYDDKSALLRAPFHYGPNRTHLIPAQLPIDALAYLVLLGRNLNENYAPFYKEMERRGVREGALLHYSAYPKGKSDWSCSARMASALALRVFLAVRPTDARIPLLLRFLMQSRTGGYFGDTRDTAWVLMAFSDYLHARPKENQTPGGTIAILINEAPVETVAAAGDNRRENGEIVLTLPARLLHQGANTLRLSRSGGSGGDVFYAGELTQTISAPSNGDLPPIAEGVHVSREVLRVVPRKEASGWTLTTEPVTNGVFSQGDRLRVRLTAIADKDAGYILIEDKFPSGAEVTERGTADEDVAQSESSSGASFWYDHVDVHDDKIAFFAGKLPKGKHVLEYNLRAQTPGMGRVLPASVRAMYDNAFRGESGTTVMEIHP